MRDLLQSFVKHRIGINYLRPHHIDPAVLVAIHDDYFTVRGEDDQALHHYPYSNIIQVAQKEGGIEIGGPFTHKQRFEVVIKIGRLVDVVPVA